MLAYCLTCRTTKIRLSAAAFFWGLFLSPALMIMTRHSTFDWVDRELTHFPGWPFSRVAVFEILIFLIFISSIFVLLFFNRGRLVDVDTRPMTAILGIVIFGLLTLLNPFLNHSVGFLNITGRMDVLAGVLCGLSIPLATAVWATRSNIGTAVILIFVCPLLFFSFMQSLPRGVSKEFMEDRINLISFLADIKAPACADPVIAAPHGDQFLITTVLGISSIHSMPAESNDHRCIFRLTKAPDENRPNGFKYRLLEESLVAPE